MSRFLYYVMALLMLYAAYSWGVKGNMQIAYMGLVVSALFCICGLLHSIHEAILLRKD